jgi:hypothetical protein
MRAWISPLVGTLLCGGAVAGAMTYPRSISPVPPAGLETVRPGAAGAPLARHTVVLVLDGTRRDRLEAILRARSRSRAIYERSAVFEGRSEHPTLSRPTYATLGSGATARLSGVATNGHRGALLLDSVFATARRAGLRVVLRDGTKWWWDLFAIPADERAGTTDDAIARLREPGRALALIHLVAADDAAHDHGAASEEYERAVERNAEILERVAAALRPERDLLFVTADHGHRDRGGHGGQEPEVVQVPFFLWGRGVRPGPHGEARGRDLAATAAIAAGLPLPAHSEGRPLLEAFDLQPARVERIAQRWMSQRWRLGNAVLGALGAPVVPPTVLPDGPGSLETARRTVTEIDARVDDAFAALTRKERWKRGLLVVPLLILLLLVVARRGLAAQGLGVAAASAACFYAVWWLLLPFSISAVRVHGEFYAHVAAVATSTQALPLCLVLWRGGAGLAVDGLAWAGILAALEVAFLFFWTGLGVGSVLPGPEGYIVPGLSLARAGAAVGLWSWAPLVARRRAGARAPAAC